MEREIIFRGKRLSNGNWVDGSLLVYADGDCFICCEDYIPDVLNKYSVDPATVGQYTGLTDKNGKKIFEGDFVEAGCKMLVTWDGKFASWCLKRKGWAYKHFFGEAVSPEDCEVVGNIWDNPELLEAKR